MNVGQCFVGIDVSKAIGYNNDDNAKSAVQTHVPGKYTMHLGDAQHIFRKEVDVDLPQEDTVLLKEPGLSCFLLHCKKPKAKPFIEWVMESFAMRGLKISLSHQRKRCSTCIAY